MKISYFNVERQISSANAYSKINQIIQEHNLKIQVISVGTDLKTYQVFLTDENLGKQFIGCGKGVGIQSEVSALFEAFEHYIGHISFLNENKIFKFTVLENQTLSYLISKNVLPEKFINLIGGANTLMPWIKFNSFKDKENTVFYPLFLVEKGYNYKNRFSYDSSFFAGFSYLSNGTGIASGTSFDEAVIHALNEVVERDATSLFLYSGFIKQQKIKIINKSTIPAYLQTYINTIETEFNDELFIIDITSDIGIPTFCVTFSKYNAPIIPKGYGTSLSKTYALERALLEALQPVHLRNDNLNRVENNTVKRLKNYPLLQQAAIADINPIIDNNNFYVSSFNDLPDLYNGQSLSVQKNQLLSLIEKKGFDIYYHDIYQTNHYSCVKIVVPGFSQLYLLQLGKLILPNVTMLSSRLP